MKKFIFIVLILFIITGCEANYTIDIDSDFNENLVVVPNGSEELQNMINYKYVHPAYYDEENYEMDDYDSTSDPYSDDSFFEDLSDNEVFTQAPIKRYNKLSGECPASLNLLIIHDKNGINSITSDIVSNNP